MQKQIEIVTQKLFSCFFDYEEIIDVKTIIDTDKIIFITEPFKKCIDSGDNCAEPELEENLSTQGLISGGKIYCYVIKINSKHELHFFNKEVAMTAYNKIKSHIGK